MQLMQRVSTERDLERLQGAWRFVSGWRQARMEVNGDAYHMEFANGTTYSGTLTLDPNARPHAMDMQIDDGPPSHVNKVCLAIYQFDGDHLIWAPGEPGTGLRLEAFPPSDDTTNLCIVFVRE